MNRSAIVWISDYGQAGVRLTESRAIAEGFARNLVADVAFTWAGPRAVDKLFERPAPAPVDAAHIVYYVGHGSYDGLVFAAKGGDYVAKYDKVELGSGDLAFAIFDCCRALNFDRMGQWRRAFQGLHYLLGFGYDVQQSAYRGTYFANFLQPPHPLPFPCAWRKAAIESEKKDKGVIPWSVLRAITAGSHVQADEFWPQAVPPRKDPDPPLKFIGLAERMVSQVGQLPSPRFPTVVKLYRTQPATEAALVSLAARFGFPVVPRTEKAGSWLLHKGVESLELYPQSGSFWWARVCPGTIVPPGPLPVPAPVSQVVQKATDFLQQRDFLDPRAFDLCVTETAWSRYEQGEHPPEIATLLRYLDLLFVLDDLLIVGPGAAMKVGLGQEGVDEFLKFWREPEPVGTIEILSVDEAEALFWAEPGFQQLPRERVQIHSRRLAYYSLPPREKQDFLLPVYVFEGSVSPPAISYTFVRYVQAALPGFRESQPPDSVFRMRPVFP